MSDIASSVARIQVEGARFRAPVSESLLQAMGAAINGLIDLLLPVGSIVDSMLTEAQFQSELGTTNWVLSDGDSCAGSAYETLTGNSTTPDLRGVYTRGKNNGRSTSTGDSAGNVALGTYAADSFAHMHRTLDYQATNNENRVYDTSGNLQELPDITATYSGSTAHIPFSGATIATGTNQDLFCGPPVGQSAGTSSAAEVRVRTVTVNKFIRIN